MFFNQKKKARSATAARSAAGAKIWVPARSAGPPPQPLGAAAGEKKIKKIEKKIEKKKKKN